MGKKHIPPEYFGKEDASTESKVEERFDDPHIYRVILHNDDFTTMEFVVEVITQVFNKPLLEATQIMLDVHKKGKGCVGVYTYDVAATKAAQVHSMARSREFPLRCSFEEA